jgi:nucleoside-diphosphate-sugar epimerase
VIRLPYPIIWSCARLNEWLAALSGKPATFNLDKLREAQVASWACSPALLQRDLKFQPPCDLRQRLQQTVDWYRHAGWL